MRPLAPHPVRRLLALVALGTAALLAPGCGAGPAGADPSSDAADGTLSSSRRKPGRTPDADAGTGTGSTDAGTGSTDAGTGSADAGTGSTDAGTGSADAGTGSTDAGTGSTDAGPEVFLTPDAPGPADVTFTLDSRQQRPISRFIYGVNALESERWWGSQRPAGIPFNRFGGNRLSAYNWETNDSNCGNDCNGFASFPNDDYLVMLDPSPRALGAAARSRYDDSRARSAALLVTVPMLGWVAADHAGSLAALPTAPSPTSPATPDGQRFLPSRAKNPAGATATPDTRDGVVYQDDFVKWLATTYPGAATDARHPLFFSLDNEPDLWGSTHAGVRGVTAAGQTVLTGHAELVNRSVEYAAAIKDVLPAAQVFGPAMSGWYGFATLGGSGTPAGFDWYLDYYLDGLRRASEAQGRRLLDVLDVHWYPESRNTCRAGEAGCYENRILDEWQPQGPSVIEARVQAPRSLWDPTYVETSWVAQSVWDCAWPSSACAVRLLPRLRESVAAHYPGTALALTEYYFGRGGDISGGLAQADALGLFGREGVWAANLWPLADVWAYNQPAGACSDQVTCATRAYACVFAAFRLFLDHDGAGGRFGDTSIGAVTSDVARTSVYASQDAGHPERVVVVALNKTQAPLSAGIALTHPLALQRAEVYRLTGDVGRCSGPTRLADISLGGRNALTVSLPPLSATVYVLRP